METQLKSAHLHGDAVNLNFGDSGKIYNAKITKISFDPNKVYYDAEVKVKKGLKTRIRMIDSNFIEKIVYSEAFTFIANAANLKYLTVGEKYLLYRNKSVGSDRDAYHTLTYRGYNKFHNAVVFDTTSVLTESKYIIDLPKLNDIGVLSLPIDRIIQEKDRPQMMPDCEMKPAEGPIVEAKDQIQVDGHIQISAYDPEKYGFNIDSEYTPQFSIKDIDRVFDDERRNHGTNPLDSINRMYRKLLALKENGARKSENKIAFNQTD